MMRILIVLLIALLVRTGSAYAVPETVSMRVTDVTTSSLSLVWMTDVAALPGLEVYSDPAMANRLTDTVTVIPMPELPQDTALAAANRGVMKVRVDGLAANTTYYVRSVTADPADPSSIGYSGLQEVTTAAMVVPYRQAGDGTLQGFANDLVAMKVYIQPNDNNASPGQGDLVLLETPASPYPVTAFAGVGAAAPEGIFDLNNLFGTDLTSLVIQGGEKTQLTIYRGGLFSTLTHYRKLPVSSGSVAVGSPLTGFFADINLDGNVDDLDFAEFRKQYRGSPYDPSYNPDYNFVEDQNNRIDAQEFARFAREYGRTGVQ